MNRPPWTSIEFRHFIALAEVGRTGSFTAAAHALGYTQSAISQQIKKLESVVGRRLVERPTTTLHSVTLTDEGKILLEHAKAIQARLDTAWADLTALSEGAVGTLRVGSYESVGTRILPHALKLFKEVWPRIDVVLEEHDDDEILLQRVEGGELDLTFMVFPLTPGPFESAELLVDPYVLVVPEESSIVTGDVPMQLDRVSDLPLIAYGKLRGIHDIAARLGRPSLNDQVIFRSNDNGTIMGMVAEGLGAAVMPRLSVDANQSGFRMVDLDRVSPRIIGIAWHRGRRITPVMQSFISAAQSSAGLLAT